jgi:hypothetical protein
MPKHLLKQEFPQLARINSDIQNEGVCFVSASIGLTCPASPACRASRGTSNSEIQVQFVDALVPFGVGISQQQLLRKRALGAL